MSSAPLLRVARVLRGLGALVVLLGLVVGVPWALWHFIGWPLPHHVPSVAQVGRALDHQGIPAQALVDALAVVVWFTWALLVASIAAEVPAALSGRHSRRLRFAGAFQPITGRLVAAVAVACLALAPRAGQPSAPGASGSAMASAMVRRPVATLVLTGADLTGTSRPVPATAIPTAPASPAPSTVAPPAVSAQNGPLRTYVVQRGDTLWGIAERELGDPLEWRAIYQLNEGRAEPGGATLTNPHWIDPGWTLLLPVAATAPAPGAAPSTPASPGAPSSPSPTTAPVGPAPVTPAPQTNGGASHPESGGVPVRLPSGSVVAASFAAGVAATVAIGRLRRRHAYRYRPPAPGRGLTPPPLRPTVEHLIHAAHARGEEEEDEELLLVDDPGEFCDGGEGPALAASNGTGGASRHFAESGVVADAECRQFPGRLEVGSLRGRSVVCDITDLSGVALYGPVADDVARAALCALVVRAGPGAAEVLLSDGLASRLLPGLRSLPAIRRVATPEGVARAVEAERIARTRRLEAAGTPDAERFRAEHPENPLPLLLVLADGPSDTSAGRWAALGAGAALLAIAVIFVTDTPAASGRVVIDDSRMVIEVEPVVLVGRLCDAELFGLGADEAVELLGAFADATTAGATSEEAGAAEYAGVGGDGQDAGRAVPSPRGSEFVWSEPAPDDDASGQAARPIRVEVLGSMQITAFGRPVATGIRSRAKTLLAWYVCRPEGASAEQAVEALWPDTPPEAVLRQFWRALGDLRAASRGPAGETPEALEKSGERYRPAPGEIACDLWELQGAITCAARAKDDDGARQALRRAVEVYRGDLLEGTGDPWVEPVRQDLHRRALDAHLRLAELEEAAGRRDAAVATLERAIELDGCAEEPYRRLMALHAARGRPDAVGSTWRQLNRRLAELDLDVEPATARLYRSLTAGNDVDASHPARLPS